MKNIFLILFLLLVFQLEAKENIKYKNLISKGENYLYNFEFEECNKIIDQAAKLDSTRPEAYQLKSKIYLWYYLGSKSESDYDKFFDYSDTTIHKIDELIAKESGNKNLIYLLGNIYKYRAMAYGSKGNTLDAFWSTKKAVSFYEDVIDIDPKFHSAFGGIGIFEYALSYVPALFNWALALSGLSADQQNGFEYIKQAAEKGEIDQTEYKFHLSKLYDEHLADFENSQIILKSLIKKYPKNILFQYQLAIELIKLKKLDHAEKLLLRIIQVNHPKFIQTNSFSNFLLGDIYLRKSEYELAFEYYDKFLTSTQTIDYTGIASLRAAYCNYFLHNDSEFNRYLLLAGNGNHDIEDDKFAFDMSQIIIEKGFSFERQVLLESENYFLSGDGQKSLEIIENNVDSLKNEDIKAQLLLYKGTILIESNKLKLAEESFNNIDSLKIEYAYWIEPLRLFNLSKIYYMQKNYKQAKEFLDLAEDKNDFQKKNIIQAQINGLRKKLEKSL